MTEYTAAQMAAMDTARREEDACIVAGPGSGKTTVLVEYFRRLVKDSGVDPLRILAITFTEKAAGNMRTKLARAFQEQPEIRGKLERAWVSTVHGFCARLLRENAVFSGIDPEFRVLDERESWRLQQDSIRAAVNALFAERLAEMRALVRGLTSWEFEPALLNCYDTLRGAGISVDALTHFPAPQGVTVEDFEETLDSLRGESLFGWKAEQREHLEDAMEAAERVIGANTTLGSLEALAGFGLKLTKCRRGNRGYELAKQLQEQAKNLEYTLITELYARERALLIELMRRFDGIYRERKRGAGALDFADLEEFAVRLLEGHADARARIQGQFDHILMDEFQDTNGQQAKLIGLIRPKDRFYAVGDINQSIFAFRHAEPEGFEDYRAEVEASERRLVELEQNFRSRAGILSAVETLTNGLPGIVQRPLIPGRQFADDPEFAVEAIVAPTPEMEAQWVARRILEMENREFHEVALLVRNTDAIPAFTAAFEEAGVPYVVNRGRGFYEGREVKDLVHLLRAIANPQDEISLAAVLRSPLCGASDDDLLRLKAEFSSVSKGLAQCEGPEYLATFRRRLGEWRMRREYCTFDGLLAAALDDVGYAWSPNVDKFLAQSRDAASRMSLDEYVAELALVREEDPREADAPPEDTSNTVKIMTVHSAKGLEFPVVFVAALEKGVRTNAPVIGFSRKSGLGARWRNPASGKDKSDLFSHALQEEWKTRDGEESSRLLYVAMTRAEEHLVLSFSASERKPANWAKVVAEALGIDHAAPRDGVETRTAPDGEEWAVRVLVAGGAPELLRRPAAASETRVVEELSAPPVQDQHDTNATVTALRTFADCPRRYYLGVYLGYEGRLRGEAKTQEEGVLSAGDLGSQVHALLAGEAVAAVDPEAERLAGVFRKSELGRRAARAERPAREVDFLLAVEELVVRGQVDLWFEEGGELVLVDYKTDDVRGAEVAERAQEYAMQVRLYGMAMERLAGRAPDRAYLHFLRPDRVVEIDLRPSLWESPEQVVREFVEAQSRLEFAMNEKERCRRCPFFKGLCPATLG